LNSPYTPGLPVNAKRYLFLDDVHVESLRNIRRNFHGVSRLSDRPFIVPDQPADRIDVATYGTVLRDTRDNTLNIWYHSQRFEEDGQHCHICYAKSADGIRWEKPDLGVIEIDGDTRNNAVARSKAPGYSPGINVIRCPDETEGSRRFRRIYQKVGGSFVAYSPDGIRWEETDEFAFRGSDSASVFYGILGKRYVAASIKVMKTTPFKRRTPVIGMSRNFREWSKFHVAFQCDDLDDWLVVERLEKRRAVLSYGIPTPTKPWRDSGATNAFASPATICALRFGGKTSGLKKWIRANRSCCAST